MFVLHVHFGSLDIFSGLDFDSVFCFCAIRIVLFICWQRFCVGC